MSDSEDEGSPYESGACSDYSDGPSTSSGLKRRNKCFIISESESDDDDEIGEEATKDGGSDASSSGEDTPGAKTCAICLGKMRGEVGSPDGCEHTFCKFCLLEWAKTNPTCPQDRIPFTKVIVRLCFSGPVDKEVPVPKAKGPDVYEFVETENPTYCEVCNRCDREDRLLLCDGCDLGYHLECLDPPLSQVPVEEWYCPLCVAVDVPDILSTGESSNVSVIRRRSRSYRSIERPRAQEPRIPRTRATERIRAHIQRKRNSKKLKRKRARESKRAKIASGELEDTRPPVTQFEELKHFVQPYSDVDAAHADDEYAEQLLAGAIHTSARYQSQRKADAAKRLRNTFFTPQASYSGARTKNKVIEKVNQTESAENDLLSGILENQAIAFSSSKKLVLTNERKLTKQPGVEISCDEIQISSDMCLEPLPSQRKMPESGSVDASDPSESSKELSSNKSEGGNSPCSSRDDSRRSPQRSSNNRSLNYQDYKGKNHSHGNHNKDNYENRGRNNHSSDRNNRMRNDHHHSKYSSNDRHSLPWNRDEPSEPSSSSHSNDKDNMSKERDHNRHSRRHERHGKYHSRDCSPHHRSSEKSSCRERKGSPSSSRHNRSHERDHGSSLSRSRRSHSKSKEDSRHSSITGGRHGRSQWGFSYFNANDNFISKNNNMSTLVSSSSQDLRHVSNSKGSASKSCVATSVPQDVTLPTNSEDVAIENLQCSEIKAADRQHIQGNGILGVDDSLVSQSRTNKDDSVPEQSTPKDYVKVPDASVYDRILKRSPQEEKQFGRNLEISGNIKQNRLSQGYKKGSDSQSSGKDEPNLSVKSVSKSFTQKKRKISDLFGDFENERKSKNESDEDTSGVEEQFTKSTKFPKKRKSKMLFGCDSDGSSMDNSDHDEPRFSDHTNNKNLNSKCEKMLGSSLPVELYVGKSHGTHNNTKENESESHEKYSTVEEGINPQYNVKEKDPSVQRINDQKEKETNLKEKHSSQDKKLESQRRNSILPKESKSLVEDCNKEDKIKISESCSSDVNEGELHVFHNEKEKRSKPPEKLEGKDDWIKNLFSSHSKTDFDKALSKAHGILNIKKNTARTQEEMENYKLFGEDSVKKSHAKVEDNDALNTRDKKNSGHLKQSSAKASNTGSSKGNLEEFSSLANEEKGKHSEPNSRNEKVNKCETQKTKKEELKASHDKRENDKGLDLKASLKRENDKGLDLKASLKREKDKGTDLKASHNKKEKGTDLKAPHDKREKDNDTDLKASHNNKEKDKGTDLKASHDKRENDKGTDLKAPHDKREKDNDTDLKTSHNNKEKDKGTDLKAPHDKREKDNDTDLKTSHNKKEKDKGTDLKVSHNKKEKDKGTDLKTSHNKEKDLKVSHNKKEKDIGTDLKAPHDKREKDNGTDLKASHGKKGKNKHESVHKGKPKKYNDFINLFGEIDDIESSCSNHDLVLKEKANEEGSPHKNEMAALEGKTDDSVHQNGTQGCSASMLDARHISSQFEDEKVMGSIVCDPESKRQEVPGPTLDIDRIKHQKALLEVKVVQEVKKALNPYYRDKAVTKEEYKEIVRKCVNKVVTAEGGDDIEPRKLQILVGGYVKLYRHRRHIHYNN